MEKMKIELRKQINYLKRMNLLSSVSWKNLDKTEKVMKGQAKCK